MIGGYRRTRAWAGGGRDYPAYVERDAHSAKFRPWFTRRTAKRIVRDLEADTAMDFGPVDEPVRAQWNGSTLVIRHEAWDDPIAVRPHGGLYPIRSPFDWVELRPSWPRRTLSPEALVRLFDAPEADERPLFDLTVARVNARTIAAALGLGPSSTTESLIYALERRLESSDDVAGLNELLLQLESRHAPIRRAAAFALRHLQTTGTLSRIQAADGPTFSEVADAVLAAGRVERAGPARYEMIWALWELEFAPALSWIVAVADLPQVDDETRALANEALAWFRGQTRLDIHLTEG